MQNECPKEAKNQVKGSDAQLIELDCALGVDAGTSALYLQPHSLGPSVKTLAGSNVTHVGNGGPVTPPLPCTIFFLVQTKVSQRTLLIIW